MRKSSDKPISFTRPGMTVLSVLISIACVAILGGILILALNPGG